jgi:hypothetical protein
MRTLKEQTRKKLAQTLTELAVFGSVLIFVIGTTVRLSMGYGYAQNNNLKAMRMAMGESFRYSHGLKGVGGDGDASRNIATVIIVEDRLTSDSAKYSALDRAQQLAMGSATHSRNLFMPVEAGEYYQMPAVDMYINGVYIALSTAKLVTVELTKKDSDEKEWNEDCKCRYIYEKIPNHPNFDYNPYPSETTTFHRFDLSRDGKNIVPNDDELRLKFSWQWRQFKATEGSMEVNQSYDVDGDLKEEGIMKIHTKGSRIKKVEVMDLQEGDVDASFNSYDAKELGQLQTGLTREVMLYNYAKKPNAGKDREGTFLQVEEGRLVDKHQITRSVTRKDTVDVISRRIRLANDTGIWCTGDGSGVPVSYANSSGYFNGMKKNPVEACGDCLGANFDKTCFEKADETYYAKLGGEEKTYYSLYVRSRIKDRRGRKWVTNVSKDPEVNLDPL